MKPKAKAAFFVLALLIMTCFALTGIMLSEDLYGYSVLFAVLGILLAGGGFSMKGRFLK